MKTGQSSQHRYIRLGKLLITGLAVITASLFFLYPQIFYCELIRFSGFRSEKGQIYFSPEIKPVRYKKLKSIIGRSEARVDSFFAGKKSKPVIIVCSNPQQYQKYCSSTEGAGCSLGTPWGNSFVILNTQGMNVDVISHEMSHTELLERLGWWTIATEIPQWFNEGIALMLDRRFVNNPDKISRYFDYMDEWLYYTGGGQQILELRDIASIKGFFNNNQKQVMLAYMSAGLEVSYWLIISEKDGLQRLISDLERGKSFEEAYRNAEEKRRAYWFKKLPTNPLRFQDSKKILE
ncbi:hypothetical protein [Dyadobacter fanqingshengii]|uniref:Peptidase MA-like domain-containing protein n=1 Tax=Dyadobacter fanqingshengii TaxID=2906443 RepID=A0A9X1TCD5_9BACT|nr:hypothetical protein [Dyadobacter fanqingshengii]MCF0043039.1 hypothetical protein [Dyadobacter fanqingshengii]USJ35592.1 hypothetical protein NFI81_23250 [Dyadobacter fanqingshengii]